jgi:hypothetical protein
MLVLPELDTYGVVPRLARHPLDIQAMAAFKLLLLRAQRRVHWDLHDMLGSGLPWKDLLSLRLDSTKLFGDDVKAQARGNKEVTLSDWSKMSDSEVKDAYMSLLKATGMDPDGSMNESNETE